MKNALLSALLLIRLHLVRNEFSEKRGHKDPPPVAFATGQTEFRAVGWFQRHLPLETVLGAPL